MRRDRQSVDPRIEHPEPARFPDPRLPRMPYADILAPHDLDLADMPVGEPGARRGDPGGETRMPGGEQRRSGLARALMQHIDLGQRRAGGFLEEDVDAALQR